MQPHCGLHCVKGYLQIPPAGAASAIGVVDIHNRLLANPASRLRFPAVTDGRRSVSRLERDASTSPAVFVERRQKRYVDEPRGRERFPDELIAGVFPMHDEVRVCDGFVIVAAVR